MLKLDDKKNLRLTTTKIILHRSYLDYYETLSNQAHPFILDSALIGAAGSRYTFMGANPFLVISASGENIEITTHSKTVRHKGNPFDTLKELLGRYKIANDVNEPFPCGTVGFFGYDLAHILEELPSRTLPDLNFPDLFFAFYNKVIRIDTIQNTAKIVSIDIPAEPVNRSPTYISKGKQVKPTVKCNFTKQDYLETIKRAKSYIAAGDIYQVNLSQRFHTKLNKNHFEIFRRLREYSPAPYSALIQLGEKSVISSSPELFLELKNGIAITRPIKGTRPRGKGDALDKKLSEELIASPKDRSELTMIIDLERNDLGKVCEPNSVKVSQFQALETHPTVHHLVATVEGKISQGIDAIDLVKAMFPGGSVTGAPKVRAMEIIDELEPARRSVYTGAFGYIGFDGNMTLAMAIRTLLADKNDLYYQSGGAIVADSDPENEYDETLVKAEGFFKSIGHDKIRIS